LLYEQNVHSVYSIHSLPYISEDVNNKNDVEADFPLDEKRFSPTRAARGAKTASSRRRSRFLYDALYRQIFYSAKPRFIAVQIPKQAGLQGGVSDSDTGDKGECTASRQGPFLGPAFR